MTRPEFPVLSADQIERLLLVCDDGSYLGWRDRALMAFLVSTGCSSEEARLLDLQDVDLTQGVATIRGEGSRHRTVPLEPRTAEYMRRYLASTRHWFRPVDGETAFFVSTQGQRLATRAVISAWQRRAKLAGFRLRAYVRQRTAADTMLRDGVDLDETNRRLGLARSPRTAIAANAVQLEGRTPFDPEAVRLTIEELEALLAKAKGGA
jgi:site-specific recombinase XerD